MEVPQQAEAGDVGDGMHLNYRHGVGGIAVEAEHTLDRGRRRFRRRYLVLDRRGDDASTDGLGQHEPIARTTATISPHPVGMNGAGYGEPVLRLVVVDAVTAQDVDARLADLVQPAAQNVAQQLRTQL